MKVSSSCMFHLGSRVSLYLSAKSGWCVHEVSGTRKSFLLTTFSQICSRELSRSVFGLAGFFLQVATALPQREAFLLEQSWFKYSDTAKDCFLTGQGQAALGSHGFLFGRLFVWVSPCQKWPNTLENGCWLPPCDHIQYPQWNPFPHQTRRVKRDEWSSPASLLHSWHWVLLWIKYTY